MAEPANTPSLPDAQQRPEPGHPADAHERDDTIVLQAWDWWLAARRARCAIPDHLGNAEVDELASAYCDIWDAADGIACATRAHTPEGVAAKLRMAFGHMVRSADGEQAFLASNGTNLEPENGLEWPAPMIASAIRDLEAIAADEARLELRP